MDTSNAKGLFRRGLAHHLCNELSSARDDLEAARRLLPQDRAVSNEMAAVLAKIKAKKDKERATYAKMFS